MAWFPNPPSATAASSVNAGKAASEAFNNQTGVNSFWWSSGYAPQWLRADFGTAQTANWYQVAPYPADTNPPTAWTFEGSNDASSWTTLDTRSGVTYPSTTQAVTFTFTNTTAYRYYRLNISQPASGPGGSGIAVSELRIGSGSPSTWLWNSTPAAATLTGDYTIGNVFRANTSGTITHFQGYKRAATGTVVFKLIDGSGTVLATESQSQSALANESWFSVPLTTPIALTSGQHYMVTAYYPGTSGYIFGPLNTADETFGDLTIPGNGLVTFLGSTANVRYASGNATPTSTAGDKHLVGVVFAPGAAAATTVAVSAELPGLDGTAAVSVPTVIAVDASLPGLDAIVSADVPTTTTVSALADLPGLDGSVEAIVYLPVDADAFGDLPTLDAAVGVLGAETEVAVDGTLPELGAYAVVAEDLTIEAASTIFDDIEVEDLFYVGLTAATDIDVALPILSEKNPSPELTASQPMHHRWVDYTPTTNVVGYAHIWVDGVDITYFRGQPTLVRNWTKERPWGDKTAIWEMPQLDPWDIPGQGDLSFIRKGAKVVIGIVDDETGAITRKWSGFYHSRSRVFGSTEDYVFEAHGTMWAAMFQAIEPVPYQPPIDIGILIPRLLNRLIGRPFHRIPTVITGLKTRYRGARDEKVWQAVQNIFARDGWTDDGRQWTLRQVAEDEFRLVLKKPMTDIDGTIAWGNPGADFDFTIDEDSRVDVVFCKWVNPGGGESANVKYPGLELLNGLPYPNADAGDFLNLGTTDADTTSGTGVTDWQTKVRQLGYTNLRVTGVMTSAWVQVVREVQQALDLTVDGSIGPQTWTATFTTVDESIDLTPRRLPMAFKKSAWPTIDGANGQILGKNPDFDGLPPNCVYLDMGTNITRSQVARAAKTYLNANKDAVVTGSARFRGCLDDLARTDLDDGDNIKVLGHEGDDVTVQVGRLSVDLDSSQGAYVVSVDADERARDALMIDQILERNRDALPDPARRPGNPNRTSRLTRDEGFSWDWDSPCGKLTKTAVNGNTGLWSRRVIPFAEIGQLAGIRLHSTVPFAMMLFASLRFSENMARRYVGNPFASTDPYRPHWATLERYGILGAWGCQGDACGYSGGQESDGYGFTGDFFEQTTLEYVTETGPYVSVLLYARGDSGFVWGFEDGDGFLPARQT